MAKNYQTNEVYNNQIGINDYEYYDNSAKNSFLGDKVFAQIRSVDEQKLIAQLSEESKRQRKLKKYLIIDIVAIVLILAVMLLLGLDIKFLSIFIPLAVVAAAVEQVPQKVLPVTEQFVPLICTLLIEDMELSFQTIILFSSVLYNKKLIL